jgi:hypothetical protein
MSQSNAIDFRKIAANEPILCIPGVFANIKEDRIRRIFADLDLGEVERIDIVVPKISVEAPQKENKFNRVFIHLLWKQTDQATAARERLLQGKEIKIIYDEPWFWKVSAYKPPVVVAKPKFQPQQKAKFQPKKATLQLDFEPTSKEKYDHPVIAEAQALRINIPDQFPDQFPDQVQDKLDYQVSKVPVQKRKTKVIIQEAAGAESK